MRERERMKVRETEKGGERKNERERERQRKGEIYVSTAVRINPKSAFEFRARSVQSFVAHLFPK